MVNFIGEITKPLLRCRQVPDQIQTACHSPFGLLLQKLGAANRCPRLNGVTMTVVESRNRLTASVALPIPKFTAPKIPSFGEFPNRIDPKRIGPSPWQPDSRTDDLRELRRSIKAEGILESIPVTAVPFKGDIADPSNQQYLIAVRGQYYWVEALGGHRRTKVAIEEGFEEVPLNWVETRSEEDRKKKFMELNVTALKLTPKHSAEIALKGGSLRPGNHKNIISKVLAVGGEELLLEITRKYGCSPGIISSVQKFMRHTAGHVPEDEIKSVALWMAKVKTANKVSNYVDTPLTEDDVMELVAAYREERMPVRRK